MRQGDQKVMVASWNLTNVKISQQKVNHDDPFLRETLQDPTSW